MRKRAHVQPSSTVSAAVAGRATDGSRPPFLPSDGEQLAELERDLAAFLLTSADGGVDTQGAFAERSPLLRRAALRVWSKLCGPTTRCSC